MRGAWLAVGAVLVGVLLLGWLLARSIGRGIAQIPRSIADDLPDLLAEGTEQSLVRAREVVESASDDALNRIAYEAGRAAADLGAAGADLEVVIPQRLAKNAEFRRGLAERLNEIVAEQRGRLI